MEDVLKNEGNKTKYSDKHKRTVESRPQLTKTIRTEKNPASNAHAKELSLVVQPRREKDEDGEKDKGKGMRARGKVDKIRQTMHAFSIYGPSIQVPALESGTKVNNPGNKGPTSNQRNKGLASERPERGTEVYAVDKEKGSYNIYIIDTIAPLVLNTHPC